MATKISAYEFDNNYKYIKDLGEGTYGQVL